MIRNKVILNWSNFGINWMENLVEYQLNFWNFPMLLHKPCQKVATGGVFGHGIWDT